MKKLFFLLLTLILFGCEMYTEESNPQLNINSVWKISTITPTFSGGNTTVINNDYFAQSPFIILYTNNGEMLIQNDIRNIQPCFLYKCGYVWEFQYNELLIKDSKGNILREYYVGMRDRYYNPSDFTLIDKITNQSIAGNWHFHQLANGSMPANDLDITVPDIYFNIESSERSFDRLICQSITLHLTR